MAPLPGPCADLLSSDDPALVSGPEAVRLTLAGSRFAALGPGAWAGFAEALERAAPPGARFELALPEDREPLLDEAVRELSRQGLRLLQLTLEPDPPGRLFVAQFLPRQPEPTEPAAALELFDPETGASWDLLPGPPLILGRDPEVAVRLTDLGVTRRHAAVHFARRAFALLADDDAQTLIDNVRGDRGVVEDRGLICLGDKVASRYVELELLLAPGDEAALLVLNGPRVGETIPLLGPAVSVGQSASADVQIVAPFVAQEHLRLTLLTDCFLVRDLGSRNGTMLNGERVSRARLLPGDELSLGGHSLQVRTPGGAAAVPPGWRLRVGDVEVPLDRAVTSIGRAADCDLGQDEEHLSRRHARLVWGPAGRPVLHDLGGRGGVRVDGRPCSSAELRGGESLLLGPVPASVIPPE